MKNQVINNKKYIRVFGVFLLFLTVILQFLHLASSYLTLIISLISLALMIFSLVEKNRSDNLFSNRKYQKKLILIVVIVIVTLGYFLMKDFS